MAAVGFRISSFSIDKVGHIDGLDSIGVDRDEEAADGEGLESNNHVDEGSILYWCLINADSLSHDVDN